MQSHREMAYLDFQHELAKQVRLRRKQLDLSQQHVAQLAGCGPVFVIDLERGKPSLRLDKVLSVLKVLGLELAVVVQTEGRGRP